MMRTKTIIASQQNPESFLPELEADFRADKAHDVVAMSNTTNTDISKIENYILSLRCCQVMLDADLTRLYQVTRDQEDEIVSIIDRHFAKSNAYFPMNNIALLPYVKNALLGQSWDGVLNLTDPIQRKYFEDYIGFNNRGN